VEYSRQGADINDESCPEELYKNVSAEERAAYEKKKQIIVIQEGDDAHKLVQCALTQVAVPLSCEQAEVQVAQSSVGWYYCEGTGEGETQSDACRYRVTLTEAAELATSGQFIAVMCDPEPTGQECL
jgi:hypothetical protein